MGWKHLLYRGKVNAPFISRRGEILGDCSWQVSVSAHESLKAALRLDELQTGVEPWNFISPPLCLFINELGHGGGFFGLMR